MHFQATEESRERKMKIVAGTEALKFSKSIELAQKQLKETHNITANEMRQKKMLDEIYATEIKRSDPNRVYDEPKALKKPEPVEVKEQEVNEEVNGGSVPKKPPRTMEYGDNDHAMNRSDDSVNVSSISMVQSVSANTSGQSTLRLGSFGSSSPKSLVVGTSSEYQSRNPVTSTPKVTFSGTVVEITEGTTAKDGNKAKKVPPPPPPRKSSTRSSLITSPVSKIQQMPLPPRPESPPTYENLEALRKRQEAERRAQRPKSAEVVREKGPPPATRPKSVSSESGEQKEGIYARPLTDTNGDDNTTEDSGGSSSSIDSQRGGKRPDGALSGQNGSKSGIPQPKSDPRKVPPPPPVRKTSALTGENSPPSEEPAYSTVKEAMGHNGQRPGVQGGQMKVSNGELVARGTSQLPKQIVAKQPMQAVAKLPANQVKTVARVHQNCEETEIY